MKDTLHEVITFKMESRSRANPEQFAALLKFMESHGDITRPQQGIQGRIKADRLWQELGELLNSIGGGVIKPLEKWKKVWADWKAKTKKKALAIRCETSSTGGGPSSRQTLTASEERLLGIMGLTAVISQAGNEDRGFDAPPSERNSLPPPTRGPSQVSATDEMLDFTCSDFIQATTASTAHPSLPPPGEVPRHPPAPVLTPPPGTASAPMPSATLPIESTSRGASQRLRRRRLVRARRSQTPFERAAGEFVAVEHRRLQLEAYREKKYHEREMEWLRLESRRIEMEENQNLILSHLTGSVDNLIDILLRFRPSSLPSTDTIS